MNRLYSLLWLCVMLLFVVAKAPEPVGDDKVDRLSDNAEHFFELMRHSSLGKSLLDPDAILGYFVNTKDEKAAEKTMKSVASTLSQLVKTVKRDGWKGALTPLKDKAVEKICDLASTSMQTMDAASGSNPIVINQNAQNQDGSKRGGSNGFMDMFL
jgi:hypothetical protein